MKSFVWALALCVGVTLLAPSQSSAQVFTDGFEAYPTGTFATVPTNGWTDFGGTQPVVISTTQAHSGTKSMRLAEGANAGNPVSPGYGSDIFRNFLPAGTTTSGKYVFSYWQFVETGVDTMAFNFHSTGFINAVTGAGFQTGLDLRTASDPAGALQGGNGILAVQQVGTSNIIFGSATQIFGAWAQHNLFIDLDNNTYNYTYNGSPVVTGLQWDRDTSDGVSLGGFDFWMQFNNTNNTTNFVYYDDFSLTAVPEPTSMLLAPMGGLLFWKLRRRKAVAAATV